MDARLHDPRRGGGHCTSGRSISVILIIIITRRGRIIQQGGFTYSRGGSGTEGERGHGVMDWLPSPRPPLLVVLTG